MHAKQIINFLCVSFFEKIKYFLCKYKNEEEMPILRFIQTNVIIKKIIEKNSLL